MYPKHNTEAIVLGSYEHGDADKMLVLLTREHGLLFVRAQSIRKEASRMKAAVQDFSRAHVSLIHGKGGWRLAGAAEVAQIPQAALPMFARVSALARRLISGDEAQPQIYELLRALSEGVNVRTYEGDDVHILELLTVARMLHALGYLSLADEQRAHISDTLVDENTLTQARAIRHELLAAVNTAIAESQL